MAKIQLVEDGKETEVDLEAMDNEQQSVVPEEAQETEVETEEETDNEPEGEQEGEPEETVFTFGDEEPEEEEEKQDSSVIRMLRKKNREQEKELKKLRKAEVDENKPSTLSKRPEIEDFDFDTAKHNEALDKWYEEKAAYNQREAEKQKAQETQAQQWQQKVDNYNNQKTELPVNDYEDVEDDVKEKLSIEQQSIIVAAATNPARLVYAIGKSKKKLDELGAIKDPIQFAVAVGKLEASMKSGTRKKPAPEKMVGGSGGVGGNPSTNLERLREQAIKSGDFTKYHKAKRAQRNK